jgi:hypothetical protein
VIVSFLLASGLVAALFVVFLVFEPSIPIYVPFGPALYVQGVLAEKAVDSTNRVLPYLTLMVWWAAIFILLSVWNLRRAR